MIRSLPLLILLLLAHPDLTGQTGGSGDICTDESCSAALDDIELDETRDPAAGIYSAERTAAFERAYRQFQPIRNGHQADAAWINKYRSSALGGRKCLRYYDLESRFAYEYDANPDFQAFIDREEPDPTAFQRNGFESSRRGMNLDHRLRKDCPKEVRKSEKDGTSDLNDRREIYQRLGEIQGYWDEEGNTLKPLEIIPNATPDEAPTRRMSKKDQVEQLNQAVAALPLGQDTKDQVGQLSDQLNELAPKADDLVENLSRAGQTVNDLLPKPGGLLDQIGSLLGLKKPLSDFVPKIPGSGILDKIKGWFGKGKKLKEKAERLRDQAKQLQDDVTQTIADAKKTAGEIAANAKEVADFQDRLTDLQEKKDDLVAKLGDKPKKILDELKQEVADTDQKARELADQIASGVADKDRLQEELDRLNEKRADLEDRIEDVADEVEELEKEEQELATEGDELQQEADRLDRQGKLLGQVEDLEPTSGAGQNTDACAEELRQLLAGLTQVEEKKKKRKFSLGRILSFPGRMLGKVNGFLDKFAGLKTILGAIPGVSNVLNIVDGLFGKSNLIAKALEVITGKQGKLTEQLDGIAGKVDRIRGIYDDKVAMVQGVQQKLAEFTGEKSGLMGLLSKPLADLTDAEAKVVALVKKHKLLGADSACSDLEPVQDELEEIDEELEEMEPVIEEMEEELEELEEEIEVIEQETEAVEQEVAEIVEQQEEVRQEEEAIREEFGQEVDLDPVTVEEYAESFEIERPYWEATFHPDDEVVEGYKGRYFQVQLKDADKKIQLLFGPGEYHMSKTDFRNQYGSVIGAFVTEALAAIKKDKRAGVKLFVQGSADISGAQSFRGNLDESFYYGELRLLPLKGSENFGGTEESRTVAERGFTNEDLPNLRGRFMQEMIGFYSKKLSPILLEGSVKEQVDKADRNAVIYLFLPESLLEE